MIIIKCDRCGSEAEGNPTRMFPMGDFENAPKYTISTFRDGEMKFISLCKNCEKDFELFLKRMEIIGGQNNKKEDDA